MVSQLQALRKTVKALGLGPEHGALVAYCEGLAEMIDKLPERATLWREYRPAVELLLSLGEADDDDGQGAFLKLVRTPVRDATKPKKANARSGGGGGRRTARPAADAVATKGRGRRSRAAG